MKKNRYKIAFAKRKETGYNELVSRSKIIIEDNDSFIKYIHVNYVNTIMTKGHQIIMTGCESISAKDNLKFYSISKKDIDSFKKLAKSNPENFEFGINILKGRVNFKEKKDGNRAEQ